MLREPSFNSLIALVFTFALTACGGGGGSSSPNNNASSPASSSLAQSSSLANSQASSESSLAVSSSSATTSASSSVAACTDCVIPLVDSFSNSIYRLFSSEGYEACFAYNAANASDEFIDEILSVGGQVGNCPEEDYFARCNYLAEDNVEALIHFTDSYAGEFDTSAIATCGFYAGIYIDPEQVVDTREDRTPSGPHYNFVRPAYTEIRAQDGVLLACQQIETAAHNQVALDSLLSNGFVLAACPNQAYVGACHTFAEGSSIGMVTYWLDTPVALFQETLCKNNSGTWQDL